MHWPPRWLAAGAVGALVVGLAAPASADPPARPTGPSRVAPAPGAAPVRITLITGDQVDLVQAAPGRVAATVRPGPGRERITFHTVEVDGGLRVLPSDVVPYVSAGVLDANLFDVQELAADGYGDAAQGALPLIVRYQEPAAGRVQPLAGATDARPLESINGAALRVGKGDLGGLWTTLARHAGSRTTTPPRPGWAPASPGSGWTARSARRWTTACRRSARPTAWAAGYDGTGVKVAVLDTGVDATHPDLAGTDRRGAGLLRQRQRRATGTATAPTSPPPSPAAARRPAGSARASRRARELLIGKVLDDDGSGYDSWIIAGMEWAADAAAPKVVNMSLGGGRHRRHRPDEPGGQRPDRRDRRAVRRSPPATTGAARDRRRARARPTRR